MFREHEENPNSSVIIVRFYRFLRLTILEDEYILEYSVVLVH